MSTMTTGHGRRGGSIEYRGALRYVAARYRYTSPPEPGTIVGPRDITNEHLVALATEGGVTLFGYATDGDLEAALTNAYVNGPRSLNERVASRLFPPLLFRGA